MKRKEKGKRNNPLPPSKVVIMTNPMTWKQQQLLNQLGNVLNDLAEECMKDDNFHEIMIDNNDIIPMSLDELASEWFAVSNGEKRERIDKQ